MRKPTLPVAETQTPKPGFAQPRRIDESAVLRHSLPFLRKDAYQTVGIVSNAINDYPEHKVMLAAYIEVIKSATLHLQDLSVNCNGSRKPPAASPAAVG